MDQDGFQIVRLKRKLASSTPAVFHHCLRGGNHGNGHQSPLERSSPSAKIDVDASVKRISACQDEIRSSELYRLLGTALRQSLARFREEQTVVTTADDKRRGSGPKTALLPPPAVATLVCYGLGNFSSCAIARYQLALFLCLKDDLKAEGFLYDPAFCEQERTLLTLLRCSIIGRNEEAKRSVDSPTLFYMPHCAKELYNNLLWANWSRSALPQVLILGNSFSHMMDNLPQRQFERSWNYISKVFPLVEERGVRNCFRFNDIFNDTSVHIFPRTRIGGLADDFFREHDEPVYQDTGTNHPC